MIFVAVVVVAKELSQCPSSFREIEGLEIDFCFCFFSFCCVILFIINLSFESLRLVEETPYFGSSMSV